MEGCKFIGLFLALGVISVIFGAPANHEFGNPDLTHNGESDRVEPVLYIREDLNDTTKFLVIDDMIIIRNQVKAGLVLGTWPNGVVPYNFALTILPQQRTMITQAIAEISAKTCIKFRPATNADKYWLLYQNDPMSRGCWSHVGWSNQKNQPIQMSTACGKGNAVHETIHALGFYHEQSRNDRDHYVKIHFENIQKGHEQNFFKDSEIGGGLDAPETSYFGQPYNYESIMHYGPYSFSKNDEPVIETLDHTNAVGDSDKMGQRDYLSPPDIGMIRAKYNCDGNSPGSGPGEGGSNPAPCKFWPFCTNKEN